MPDFFVDADLRDADSAGFIALIPDQRSLINELFFEGKLISYAVSADRTKLWIILPADDMAGVRTILNSFPLIGYMSIDIHELMFHNNSQQALSQISLN